MLCKILSVFERRLHRKMTEGEMILSGVFSLAFIQRFNIVSLNS